MMHLSDFEFVQLTQDMPLLPFVSEDEDLNSFLMEDAKNYSADLMAVTYLFIDKEKQQTVAYFSLLNDKVAYDPREKGIWNRINRLIPNSKRRRSYPSAKIARLAVARSYEREGLGSQILEYVKYFMVTEPKIGCRFLTVDAYANATPFYEKNRFQYFTMLDTLDKTRLMYFDLKPFKEHIEQGL
jgi:GNAT superfamily N-acetyltransferase